MTSSDKDFRFMATNDLMTELQKDSIKLDDESERKVCHLLSALVTSFSRFHIIWKAFFHRIVENPAKPLLPIQYPNLKMKIHFKNATIMKGNLKSTLQFTDTEQFFF